MGIMQLRPHVFKYTTAHRDCYCIPASTQYEQLVVEQLKQVRTEASWETDISPLIATFVDDEFHSLHEIFEYARTLSPPFTTNNPIEHDLLQWIRTREFTRYILTKIEHDFGRRGFRSMSFIGEYPSLVRARAAMFYEILKEVPKMIESLENMALEDGYCPEYDENGKDCSSDCEAWKKYARDVAHEYNIEVEGLSVEERRVRFALVNNYDF